MERPLEGGGHSFPKVSPLDSAGGDCLGGHHQNKSIPQQETVQKLFTNIRHSPDLDAVAKHPDPGVTRRR